MKCKCGKEAYAWQSCDKHGICMDCQPDWIKHFGIQWGTQPQESVEESKTQHPTAKV